MNDVKITCPHCHTPIEVSTALRGPIEAQLRQQLEAGVKQREAALRQQAEQLTAEKAALDEQVRQKLQAEQQKLAQQIEADVQNRMETQLKALQQQVQSKSTELRDLKNRELNLLKLKGELEQQKESMDLELQRKLETERAAIRAAAEKGAAERAAIELKDLQQKLADRQTALETAQQSELKLRQERDSFQNEKKEFELQRLRLIEEEREKARKLAEEEHRLKELEKEKLINGLKQQIEVLKQKAEQGSQQLQGEVQELDLEEALRKCFTTDEIAEVGKGQSGGDILQHVRDEAGRACGTIIWESKRTRNWTEGWIDKLKQDKRTAKADVAILVTTAMPKEVVSFECRDSVWVTTPALAVPVAWALRFALTEAAGAKRAMEGQHDKMALVYQYLSGNQFKERVMGIFEAFSTMQDDLEKEKAAMLRMWAKREKQIQRVIATTTGLHGELSGIIGSALPAIESMELAMLGQDDA